MAKIIQASTQKNVIILLDALSEVTTINKSHAFLYRFSEYL